MPALIPLSYVGARLRIDSSAPHWARPRILGASPGVSTAATKAGSALALGGWATPDAAVPKPSIIGAAATYLRTSRRETDGDVEQPHQLGIGNTVTRGNTIHNATRRSRIRLNTAGSWWCPQGLSLHQSRARRLRRGRRP